MGRKAAIKLLLAALSCFAAHGLRGQEELPLPRWSEEELRTFRGLKTQLPSSETLLPECAEQTTGFDQLLSGLAHSWTYLDDLPDTLSGAMQPRLTMDHMRFFLPDLHNIPAAQDICSAKPVQSAMPTAITALREVSSEFLKAARSVPGDLFLIDPDSRVPEMATMELTRLLEFHASDACIRLYVLVMGKNEKLPANAPLDEVASGRLLKTNACLVVYPVGEPWRAQLFVSQPVLDVASHSFFVETSGEGVKQAMQASEAHDQLERYIVSLSTRLFCLQKALGKDLRHNGVHSTLRELSAPVASREASILPAALPISPMQGTAWPLWLALLGGGAGAVWVGIRWHRNRQQRFKTCVWTLPETDTVPRLGAAFCGGGGMVKFG